MAAASPPPASVRERAGPRAPSAGAHDTPLRELLMNHRFACLLRHGARGFACAALFVSLAPPPARAATLQLNEVLAGPARDWDGSGALSTRDDEWVELRNASAAPIDLAGFILTDRDSIPRFALSGTLGPGARRTVFGKESYDWEKANGQPAFGLSLGNSGDAVILWQIVGADTVVVDAYTYRSHEAAADRSVGRMNDDGPWSLFDGLNPYTGTTLPAGSGCNPSPAAANDCAATAARRGTWGALKMIYR
jgi:hypothetical protein